MIAGEDLKKVYELRDRYAAMSKLTKNANLLSYYEGAVDALNAIVKMR